MVGWIEAAVLVPRDRLQAMDFRVSVIPHSTLFDTTERGLGEPLQPLKMARSSGCRLVVLPRATGDYFPISELRGGYLAVIRRIGARKSRSSQVARQRSEQKRLGKALPCLRAIVLRPHMWQDEISSVIESPQLRNLQCLVSRARILNKKVDWRSGPTSISEALRRMRKPISSLLLPRFFTSTDKPPNRP
jgi:hypothetical protein